MTYKKHPHNADASCFLLEQSWAIRQTVLPMSIEDEEGNVSNQELHFFYDSQSKPAFVEFEGERYRYVHSLQGDIIAIVDSASNTVVEYKYDAWGKPISINSATNDNIGDINPFRYRGYVFDDEIKAFYLRSRYYNPSLCRMLNADALLGSIGDVCGHNVFAYAMNTPVKMIDPDGMSIFSAVSTAISVFKSAIKAVINGAKKVASMVKNYAEKNEQKTIDITDRLNLALQENYEYISNYFAENKKKYGAVIAYAMANVEFAKKVKSGGEWDYKSSWNLDRDQIYLFNGIEITYQDPGNINFGYAGSALHTLSDLHAFAGEYQIVSKTSDWSYWRTCFDDPDDYSAITYGYLLKQGSYSTAFTSYNLN